MCHFTRPILNMRALWSLHLASPPKTILCLAKPVDHIFNSRLFRLQLLVRAGLRDVFIHRKVLVGLALAQLTKVAQVRAFREWVVILVDQSSNRLQCRGAFGAGAQQLLEDPARLVDDGQVGQVA
jgi:hypothetical protein